MLGSPAAKRLQVLKVGPELVNMTTIYFKDSDINGIVGCFSKMFSGVGKLSGVGSTEEKVRTLFMKQTLF